MLKALSKHKGWSATKAVSVIDALDRDSFSSPTDYAEGVTAALIGQRWESVHGKQGYDTASTLTRWLGKGASKYGNPEILFDAKTQRKGVGYSEKVPERASKATDYLERRKAGGVINGVVFHTRHGVFFQLGIDHESTTPQFGKRKRPIVGHEALPRLIDGNGSWWVSTLGHNHPRLVAALTKSSGESLAAALHVGELLGTLSLLESQAVISRGERLDIVKDAGLSEDLTEGIWGRLTGGARVHNEAAEL